MFRPTPCQMMSKNKPNHDHKIPRQNHEISPCSFVVPLSGACTGTRIWARWLLGINLYVTIFFHSSLWKCCIFPLCDCVYHINQDSYSLICNIGLFGAFLPSTTSSCGFKWGPTDACVYKYLYMYMYMHMYMYMYKQMYMDRIDSNHQHYIMYIYNDVYIYIIYIYL